jgi:hypothetical protein
MEHVFLCSPVHLFLFPGLLPVNAFGFVIRKYPSMHYISVLAPEIVSCNTHVLPLRPAMAMQLLVYKKARTHVYVYAVEVVAFISNLVYDLPCMGSPFLWHKE